MTLVLMGYNQCDRYYLRVERAEVDIKISSAIVNIKTLEYAELVSGMGFRGRWNVVLDWRYIY